MGFWKNLFRKYKELTEDEEYSFDEEVVYDRSNLHVHDSRERRNYVRGCLDQIEDASRELDLLKKEYNVVTSYLTDMEEVESMPPEMRTQLEETAHHLLALHDTKDRFHERESKISDEQFQAMEQMEEEVESGLEHLEEAERYQKLVKNDLRRLDNERRSYAYRHRELEADMDNYRGMTLVSFVTMVACMLILLVLQLALHLDVKIGYILAICAAALVMILLYVKHEDAVHEIDRVENTINKLIQLQNTVKIRYVNNKNLLDYLCLKFRVSSGSELRENWEHYQEEKEARAAYDTATKDYLFYRDDLVKQLRYSRVKDPEIWLHQTEALVDPREMVEARHKYIVRRQALRSQMEYNKNVATAAQDEIRALAADFPMYQEEILEMVTERPDD